MTNPSSYGEASDISVPAYQRGFQTLERETSVAALKECLNKGLRVDARH